MRKIFSLLILVLVMPGAHAQTDAITAPESKTTVHLPLQRCASELQWIDAKPPMPTGAKVAVIEGNPKTEGHFTIRLKFPPYYKIPAHLHPVDERTTVLSGAINVGFGEILDTTSATRLEAGCFYVNPAGVHHFAFTSEQETEVQVSTNGPWGLELIEQ